MKKSLVSIFLALFCYAAIAAFITPSIQLKPSAKSASFNTEQDRNAQDKNVEDAKRFVGAWKGKLPNMPTDLPPNTNIDTVLIFKMEGRPVERDGTRVWDPQKQRGGASDCPR